MIVSTEDRMPPERIHLQNLDESTRRTFHRLASERGWEVVDSLPADVIVLGAGENLAEEIDGLARTAPHTPVIAVGGDSVTRAEEAGAQAYVADNQPEAIAARVQMLLDTIHRYAAVHPLTGLPGSPAIQHEIERRLPESGQMGCLLCDIDNFKAFNDAYGFRRGDGMILSLKQLLQQCARPYDPSDVFIGHIGGDDFMVIATPPQAEVIGKKAVAEFGDLSNELVDKRDRERGFIETLARTGQMQRFPLPTLTAVMVTNEADDVRHPGRVSAILAELKAYVKPMEGSNFFRDRRKHHDSGESLARKPK